MMLKTLLLTASVAVSFVATQAPEEFPDFIIPGKCPYVDEKSLWDQQKPNLAKFGGVWYQQAISTNPYQKMKRCVHIQYDFNGSGFDVTTSGITAQGKPGKMRGNFVPMPLGEPHLMVQFKDVWASPLIILDTDYKNYACLYSCVDYNYKYYSDFAFFFSREPTPSSSLIKRCERVFREINFDLNRLKKTQQGGDCDYEQVKRARDEL